MVQATADRPCDELAVGELRRGQFGIRVGNAVDALMCETNNGGTQNSINPTWGLKKAAFKSKRFVLGDTRLLLMSLGSKSSPFCRPLISPLITGRSVPCWASFFAP